MINLYLQTIPVFTRHLTQLQKYLIKAKTFSEVKKFDVDILMQARLAPDMYPLGKQIQICSDMAKGTAARLTGKESPKYDDTEKTFAELHQRLQKTIDYLATYKPEDFNGAEDRRVIIPFAPDKYLHGGEYLVDMMTPNFYFHYTTAYNILRHSGVELGKGDFIGDIQLKSVT